MLISPERLAQQYFAVCLIGQTLLSPDAAQSIEIVWQHPDRHRFELRNASRPSRLRKNSATDGSVHTTESHRTDSTFAVGDRFVCPRVFPQPARRNIGSIRRHASDWRKTTQQDRR